MSLQLRSYIGAQIAPHVDELARLRIAVFRDWPYLYEGDLDYERRYLSGYARGDTILVAASDGEATVGASTGMPLSDHADDFAAAFEGSGVNLNDAFYCAESVLLPSHRGQGAYAGFFARREDHARALGFKYSTFCAVIRQDIHSLRPAGHQPLDPVWRRFGYAPLPGVIAHFNWRDIGDDNETAKPLQFWIKTL